MRRECRERFPRHRLQRKPLVSDPGMHHDTCVTHVPRCMPGSLIHGGGESVPGIPDACATGNFTYLARGPSAGKVRVQCSKAKTAHCMTSVLTHWSRVTHICVGNLTIIGSDNGLAPGRNSYIFIQENVFRNVVCEMAAILYRSHYVNIPHTLPHHQQRRMHQKQTPETKWPTICKWHWHFQMHFLERNMLHCDLHFTDFFRGGPMANNTSIVQIMTWCRTGAKAIAWTNDGLVYWSIRVSLGLDELAGVRCERNHTSFNLRWGRSILTLTLYTHDLFYFWCHMYIPPRWCLRICFATAFKL